MRLLIHQAHLFHYTTVSDTSRMYLHVNICLIIVQFIWAAAYRRNEPTWHPRGPFAYIRCNCCSSVKLFEGTSDLVSFICKGYSRRSSQCSGLHSSAFRNGAR